MLMISQIAIVERNRSRQSESGNLAKRLCAIGDFVRGIPTRARAGSLSRASLRFLRFELHESHAECDWVARPPDEWDASLPSVVGEHHASLQTLKDAIQVRSLLLRLIPNVETALLQIYRRSDGDSLELIVRGQVHRAERAPAAVRSLAMRAKLYGFQFWMDDGVLEPLQTEEFQVSDYDAVRRIDTGDADAR